MKFVRPFVLITLALFLGLAAVSVNAQSGRRPGYQGTDGVPKAPAPPGSNNGACPVTLFPGEYPGASARQTNQGQASAKSDDPNSEAVLKIDTTLVTIPVTVLDREGRFVPSLTRCDFHIYEDEVRQELAEFSSVDTPFHVVLLIDTSNSTRFKIDQIQEAALAFVNQLRQDDKVMVVSFDSDIHVHSEFTSDREALRRAIYQTRTGGSTKLYDAVDWVINQRLANIQGRKAVVLFTDGVDTSSKRATARSNIDLVEESDVLVYPIQYDTYEQMNRGGRPGQYPPRSGPRPPIWGNPFPGGSSRRRWPIGNPVVPQIVVRRGQGGLEEYKNAGIYLEDLATHSGGRHQSAENIGDVNKAFSSIAEELRHQYSLGYYPVNTAQDGTLRKIRVRVSQYGWVIRGKESYRAAAGGRTAPESQDRPVMRRRTP